MAAQNQTSSSTERLKLNVGGRQFETSAATVFSGGPDSLLAAIFSRPGLHSGEPVFIDRDPDIFSVLLTLLRSGRLPSAAGRFSAQELADEALYYGLESRLRSAVSPPPFSGVDAAVAALIRPAVDPVPSSIAAADDGSLCVAHGGQISAYDWSLAHAGTVRTHLDHIAPLLRLRPDLAAVGSSSAAGLHLYNTSGRRLSASVHWSDPSDPRIRRAHVTAVADSSSSSSSSAAAAHLFSAFACDHGENCILAIDKSTVQIVSEIVRLSGASTKTAAPGRLAFLRRSGLVGAAAVSGGAFGYAGYIRLWDPRSGEMVWETMEPGSGRSTRFGDPFSAVEFEGEKEMVWKVGSKTGDVGVADLRVLGEDPWVYLEEKNPSLSRVGWAGDVALHCYRDQVFVGRGGGLEVWSSSVGRRGEDVVRNFGMYRRNYMGGSPDPVRTVAEIEGGGDRLFVRFENDEGVEVWESSESLSKMRVRDFG